MLHGISKDFPSLGPLIKAAPIGLFAIGITSLIPPLYRFLRQKNKPLPSTVGLSPAPHPTTLLQSVTTEEPEALPEDPKELRQSRHKALTVGEAQISPSSHRLGNQGKLTKEPVRRN